MSQNQFRLKQHIFSCQVLWNDGGAISPAQRGVGTSHQRGKRSHCWLAPELIGSRKLARGGLGRSCLTGF